MQISVKAMHMCKQYYMYIDSKYIKLCSIVGY